MNLEYVVWAPMPYTAISGGIRALYKLASELQWRDQNVSMASLGASPWRSADCPFDIPVASEFSLDAVHIYPEYIGRHPTASPRGVQWLLGPRRCETGDIEFAWTDHLGPDIPRLTVDIVEAENFYPKGKPGSGVLWWRGNGLLPYGLEGGREITCQSPANRKELGDVLRGAELLVSFDPFSALLLEASVCGTPVLIPDGIEPIQSSLFGHTGIAFGESQLDQARSEVHLAAEKYQLVREEIATDVDRLIALTEQRFGGESCHSQSRTVSVPLLM